MLPLLASTAGRHRAGISIAKVQYQGGGNTLAASYTLAITTTTGNSLWVVAASTQTFGATPVSDGVNTFTALTGNGTKRAGWFAKNITGNSTGITITATASTGGIAVAVLELSGASLTSPVNHQADGTGTTSTALASLATAAGAVGNWVVGLGSWTGAGSADTISSRAFSSALTSQTDETEANSGGIVAATQASVCLSHGPIAGANTELFSGTLSAAAAGWIAFCICVH